MGEGHTPGLGDAATLTSGDNRGMDSPERRWAPVLLAAALGLLALAELAARLPVSSTTRAGVPRSPVTHIGPSVLAALLMAVFCLLTTVPAGLRPPVPAAVAVWAAVARGAREVDRATRQLAGAGDPGPRVLILTTFDLDEYVFDALRAGASGFLLKDVTAERLFDAVRVVAAGEALLAPAVTRRLISEFTRLQPVAGAPPSAVLSALTPRETEVLRLVAEGLSNPELARRLVVTEETVKTHVSRILAKLGLRDRTRAVVAAYEAGLVIPGRERG
jgi:DNA-binding NarL/FixJ family response regulator